MKYIISFCFLMAAISLSSCKRCTDCSCTHDLTFEFVGYDTATQTLIENTWIQGFNDDYPDEQVEICDTRGKNFKGSVQAYRDKSDYQKVTYGNSVIGYTYEWNRTCACDYTK